MATSIKVAEAAKVIETHSDLNIALMNELFAPLITLILIHIVFWPLRQPMEFSPVQSRVGWRALHCRSYYLTSKAISVGYIPDVILAGRRLNDGMPKHVVDTTIKEMLKRNIDISKSSVLMLGLLKRTAQILKFKGFEAATLLADLWVQLTCMTFSRVYSQRGVVRTGP